MSIDQNESQASLGQQTLSTEQNSPSAGQGGQGQQQQQRRRRRRRKSGKGAGAGAQGTAGATEGTTPSAATVDPSQAPEAAGNAQAQPASEPQREEGRSRDGGRPREASSQEPGREQRPRNDRRDQPQGKKQQGQRRAKGGGQGQNPGQNQGQGRQFSKGGHTQGAPREHNPGNSNGAYQQTGGGARRKQKVRRAAPTFVGPMDHSYRTVNGNIADGPPSTMDFRSNANGNGNGNGFAHGRNGYSDVPEHIPAIIREDAPARIVCFIEDLFVVAKMQETARKIGVKVSFARAEKDTVTKLTDASAEERPSLIVFDLNNANAKPLTLIPKLKAKLKRGTSVIGFLSHIQGDLKVKAIEAGCDMVMPKSAFSQNLPNLLRRHGLDEELDAVEV